MSRITLSISFLYLILAHSSYADTSFELPSGFSCPEGTRLVEQGDARNKRLSNGDRIYSCLDLKGREQGSVVRVNVDEVIIYDGGRKDGKLHGVMLWRYRTGELKSETHYLEGVPSGKSTHWDSFGRVSRIDFFEDGKIVKTINELGEQIEAQGATSVLPSLIKVKQTAPKKLLLEIAKLNGGDVTIRDELLKVCVGVLPSLQRSTVEKLEVAKLKILKKTKSQRIEEIKTLLCPHVIMDNEV